MTMETSFARPLPDHLTLKTGSHVSLDAGACVMEIVSHVAGEPWSHQPQCACPVFAACFVRLNDARWPSDEARTEALAPAIALLVGSRTGREGERRRANALAHLAASEFVPWALMCAVDALEARGYDATELRAAGLALCENPCAETLTAARQAAASWRAAAAAADASAAAAAAWRAAAAAAATASAWRAAAEAAATAAAEAAAASWRAEAAADAADAADAAARGLVLRLAAERIIDLLRAEVTAPTPVDTERSA